MEFPFNLNNFFSEETTKIETNLLPFGFQGFSDARRCAAAVGDILDKMGQASAHAQELINPVTSAIRYNNSNHIIYLMVNLTENDGRGTVVGLLKMGWKDLFVVDLQGTYTKQHCFCCLDFYIHETKQRQGFGKQLYDFMLRDNNIKAGIIPIDRPSKKLIKFLYKYYNLQTIIPQQNNFVIYEQFFCDNVNCSTSERLQLYDKNVNSSCRPTFKTRTSLEDGVLDKWHKKIKSVNR